jgi:ABC-2 type transport system permease protein
MTAMSSARAAAAADRARAWSSRPPARPTGVFLALLRRDVVVARREVTTILAQGIMQPLFLLFVFGRVLTSLGYAQATYADLLFPGIVALTVVLTALQSSAVPLVLDFSFSREIEDRLLAPIRTSLVAWEKMVFAALRAMFAGVLMFPIGVLVLGGVPWRVSALPLLVVGSVLGALFGSALGMTLGTAIAPSRISGMFALILTPLLFTGCTQYPWLSLAKLRWFQVLTAANPVTYYSEIMRAALVPGVSHLPPWLSLPALAAAVAVLCWTGQRGFARRARD